MKYDLVGQKFSKLTVIKKDENKIINRKRYWLCICECGRNTTVETSKLVSNHTKSCGCLYHDDIIDKKFGKLTVIKYEKSENGRSIWQCKCDCGNIKSVFAQNLVNKHTSSCGCLNQSGKGNKNWNGCGDMSGSMWLQIVKRNKNGNYNNFNITKEYLWDLFLRQNKKCALSGIDLKFDSKQTCRDGNASLDRIKSDRGYEIGNVQWIHKDINWMKLDFDQDYFLNICKIISEYAKCSNGSCPIK